MYSKIPTLSILRQAQKLGPILVGQKTDFLKVETILTVPIPSFLHALLSVYIWCASPIKIHLIR